MSKCVCVCVYLMKAIAKARARVIQRGRDRIKKRAENGPHIVTVVVFMSKNAVLYTIRCDTRYDVIIHT